MKCLLFALAVLFCQWGKAQIFPAYCVYLVKGKATVKSTSRYAVELKQKQLIYNSDTIIIPLHSEVQLMNKDARFFILNAPGSYAASELEKKILPKTPPHLTSTYLKLVYHEVLDPHYDFSKFQKNNVGAVYGASIRGAPCQLVFPFDGLKNSDDSLQFIWNRTKNSHDYILLLFAEGGEKPLATFPVDDTSFTANMKLLSPAKSGIYSWTVQCKNCEEQPHWDFRQIDKKEEELEVGSLINWSDTLELTEQLGLVDKLESKGYISMASKLYSRLLWIYPDNAALMRSYIIFLHRNQKHYQAESLQRQISGN